MFPHFTLQVHHSIGVEPTLLPQLVCVASPCQPHQGRFTAKNFIYVFTLHQTAFQPSKVVRPLCGSGSRNFKNSYRCPKYKHKLPPLPVPALSLLGAGRLITFGAVLTSKLFSYRLAGLLSLILGKVLFNGSTSWSIPSQGFSVCLRLRLRHLAAVQFSFNSSKLVLRDTPCLHHFSTI